MRCTPNISRCVHVLLVQKMDLSLNKNRQMKRPSVKILKGSIKTLTYRIRRSPRVFVYSNAI